MTRLNIPLQSLVVLGQGSAYITRVGEWHSFMTYMIELKMLGYSK